MNLFKELRSAVIAAVEQLGRQENWPLGDLPLDAITVELPRDASHGDAATNAAMLLAKPLGENPREIAGKLVAALQNLPHLQQAEIAGPGFINFRLDPAFWQRILPAILRLGRDYGQSEMGAGKKVNVEYVSANPTGPMHVGHARGAVVGDALATLLQKAGYQVTREYYINDAGSQVESLARSVYLRYREALGEDIGTIPEGFYPGEYLIPAGRALADAHGDSLRGMPEEEWLPPVRRFAIEAMMDLIREDLALLGIHHDVFSSEQEIRDKGLVEQAIAALEARGLIYTGVLEPPKGKTPDDWEPRPQTLFKSTEFGDDLDRAIRKSDGSWTYFAPDIAYHKDKCDRGFDILIDILGADHGGYVKRIKAVVTALSHGKVQMEVKLCQLVKFLRGGEPAKMSKRAGTFVTAREVVEEVGRGALRFIMLTRKNDAALDFDFEKVMEQSKDNPVFYVQYAHARCRSVLRNAAAQMPEAVRRSGVEADAFAKTFTHEADLSLLKKLSCWPVAVEQAASAFEPHRIAYYLEDLAGAFHSLWTSGNENEDLRFLVPDETVTAARLVLVQAIAAVLASGLEVLGVEPVEEMR